VTYLTIQGRGQFEGIRAAGGTKRCHSPPANPRILQAPFPTRGVS